MTDLDDISPAAPEAAPKAKAKAKQRPARARRPSGLWHSLAPAMPATLGTMGLTFLFAAVMPLPWVAGLAWNLYLDRLSPVFQPPVGDAGRLALAVAIALIAGLIALVAALALAKPDVQGNKAMNDKIAARARKQQDEAPAEVPEAIRRRRADLHPDDPPRAPISATRDLPAGGLGPLTPGDAVTDKDDDALDLSMMARADDLPHTSTAQDGEGDVFDLAGFASVEEGVAPAPAAPAEPDGSLGSMVARFEQGLQRRRQHRAQRAQSPDAAAPASDGDEEPVVDFALEAALSTLQRMSRRAVG